MNTINTLEHRLDTAMSDRAFRVFCVLVLRTAGEWRDIPYVADAVNLTTHEIRSTIAELHTAGLIRKERRYETGVSGRKTWHTYIALTDDTTPLSSAVEDAA
ncbi:hypothetical protein [Streptomyces anulatus]|uniref:hypothetical protein n=1 Tax=Streptomyces anulatus TaxID=1892 RepID=UPI0037DD0F71|nr:hypothetical protein OHB50_39040 [Streptomyces anulatus]